MWFTSATFSSFSQFKTSIFRAGFFGEPHIVSRGTSPILNGFAAVGLTLCPEACVPLSDAEMAIDSLAHACSGAGFAVSFATSSLVYRLLPLPGSSCFKSGCSSSALRLELWSRVSNLSFGSFAFPRFMGLQGITEEVKEVEIMW
jgi:hypothetical protein